MRVVEGREELSFALKLRDALRVVAKRLRQDFDRDLTTQLGVAGPIDFAHAAGADRGGNLVRTKQTA